MRLRDATVVAGLALGLMSGTAKAAVITATYDFDLTSSGGPISDVIGSLTTTYDPTAMSGAVLDSFSSNLPSAFLPAQIAQSGNFLFFGNNCSAMSCGINAAGDVNQFTVFFSVNSQGSVIGQGSGLYDTSSALASDSLTGTITLSSVPLPASAPMFGAAILALGAVGYSLKRKGNATA